MPRCAIEIISQVLGYQANVLLPPLLKVPLAERVVTKGKRLGWRLAPSMCQKLVREDTVHTLSRGGLRFQAN